MIVDSYAHVSLKKYQPVEQLMKQMDAAKVGRTVLVQPMGDYDNSYLRKILVRYPGCFLAVGLLDPVSPSLAAELKQLIESDGFAGVRATAELFRNRELVEDLAARDGVLVTHLPNGVGQNLDLLSEIAKEYPHLRVFLPHLGWPRTEGQATPNWKPAVEALSSYPNVAIGISAIHYFSEQPFPHQDIWDAVQMVLNAFGPERCMGGSDFPLLFEAESYSDFFSFLADGPLRISPEGRGFLLGKTAIRFWRIKR